MEVVFGGSFVGKKHFAVVLVARMVLVEFWGLDTDEMIVEKEEL